MVATYSPQGDLGGTLHYPSPSHVRHVEGTSAFKHLRRSLSRSPSKNPTFRLITSKSTSPSPHSPLSPSCISPPVRSASAGLLPSLNSAQPSPLATPLSLSPRKNRCSTRRLSPMRSVSRSRSSQRSPGRMSLSDSRNNGNATPQSSAQSSTQSSEDIENRTARSVSPLGDVSKETNLKSAGTGPRENHLAQHRAITKIEKNNGGPGPLCAKSSPLKRSDGIMNLDQVGFGSPAKRRSLHGANFGSDFDIFDHEAAFQGHPDSQDSQEASSLGFSSYLEFSFAISPLPKRTSSLRRTTLQHRHDKPTFARSKLHADLALDATASGQVTSTSKPRMSLDSLLPPPIRDSPFSSQGGLPNASAHLLPQQNVKQSDMGNTAQLQRHPLSRTITQSSSNSSLAEDSPTHIPVRQPDHRRPTVDFSKSLPLGMRPGSREDRVSDLSSQETSTELAVSTPENYKLAKPLPAAFMSTGLISKRHKDIDDLQTAYQGEKSLMPDTPCKRQSVVGVAQTALAPSSAAIKARHLRHSFGAPSTPISPHPSRIAPETLGKGVSIFGSNISKGKIDRRSSFLSFDGDDHLRSSPENVKSQTSYGIQMSPTPTKQAQVSANISRAHLEGVPTAPSGHDSIADPCLCSSGELDPDKFKCKLISVGTPAGSANKDSDKMVDNSSPIVLRLGKYSSISSFTASRSLRQFKSPTPLLKSQIVSPFPLSKSRAKPSPLSPASPIPEQPEQMSPHTPRESMLPPDPSGLSISARIDGQSRPSQNGLPGGASMVPPATPTAPRELFSSLGDGRSSLHLSHNAPIVDVDPSLTSRFDKVDLIGTGEFSHVYRVTQAQEPRSSRGYFSFQTTHGSPRTPLPDRVWAVKKSRHPIIGPKDRRRKLQEVNTLRSIGQADHVIHLIDSWEENNHLYIQTEFCEEGSLDLFLDQVGRKARLDDFRIWKIMLELSLVNLLRCVMSQAANQISRASNIFMILASFTWTLNQQIFSSPLKEV